MATMPDLDDLTTPETRRMMVEDVLDRIHPDQRDKALDALSHLCADIYTLTVAHVLEKLRQEWSSTMAIMTRQEPRPKPKNNK